MTPASPTARECAMCGEPLESAEAASAADLDLANANKMRLAGELKEAEQAVLAVMRRFPTHIDAHVLMGEINLDMKRHQEAANWFGMALDLNPDNLRLKARRDEAMRLTREEDLTEVAKGIPLDDKKPQRLWATGLLIVLGGAVAGAGFWAGRSVAPPVKEASPIRQVVSMTDPPLPFQMPAADSPSQEPLATPREASLTQLLRGRLPVGALQAVHEDPRIPSIGITLAAEDEALLASLAAQAAGAALGSDSQIQGVTVRIFVAGSIAYVADATRGSYDAIRAEELEPADDPTRLLTSAQQYAVTPRSARASE